MLRASWTAPQGRAQWSNSLLKSTPCRNTLMPAQKIFWARFTTGATWWRPTVKYLVGCCVDGMHLRCIWMNQALPDS